MADVINTFNKAYNSGILTFFIIFIVGRRSIPHNGVKVWSLRPSIQGQWVSNMWNSHLKHGIEEFKSTPQIVLSEEVKLSKPAVRKNKPDAIVRKSRNNRFTFNI